MIGETATFYSKKKKKSISGTIVKENAKTVLIDLGKDGVIKKKKRQIGREV